MKFSHRLARDAKVWPCLSPTNESKKVLVVLTTLELTSDNKRFKTDKVERLRSAAQEWLSFNQDEAEGYVLINRPKDW